MESIIETMGLKATATSAIASNATPIAGTDMSKSEDRTAVYASQQHPSVAAPIGRRWSEEQYLDLCKRIDAEHEYRQVLADNWRDEEILNCLPDVERVDGKVPESTIYAYAEHRDIPRSVVDNVMRKYAPTAEQQRELARHSAPSVDVVAMEMVDALSALCSRIDDDSGQNITLKHRQFNSIYQGHILQVKVYARQSRWRKKQLLKLGYAFLKNRLYRHDACVYDPAAFELFGQSLEALAVATPLLPEIHRGYVIRSDGSIKKL